MSRRVSARCQRYQPSFVLSYSRGALGSAICVCGHGALGAGLAVLLRDTALDLWGAKAARDDGRYEIVPMVSPQLLRAPLTAFSAALRVPLLGDAIIAWISKDNEVGMVASYVATINHAFFSQILPDARTDRGGAGARAVQHHGVCGASDAFKVSQASPFRYYSIADYTSRYAAGVVTPTEVAKRVLDAVSRSDVATPPLRAFTSILPADVRAQAEESTARYRKGAPLGPLDGVPIAIKDEIDVKGHRMTVGTDFLAATFGAAEEDSIPVARLRAAGAVIIGKTNMHEIGIGTTGLNTHHGTPRNPHNPEYHTGGSSAGSAAAVAAGLVPVAIGVDGGGSIRIPAALCGLVGVKATFGRVACPAPDAPSVAHVGPIATNAKDAAVVYAAVAGAHEAVEESLPQPGVHVPVLSDAAADVARAPLKGVTVGVYEEWVNDAEEEVVAACRKAIEHLKAAGAVVQQVQIPNLRVMNMAHGITILSEMAAAMTKHSANFTRFCAETQVSLKLGEKFSARELLAAQQVRAYHTHVHRELFKDVDLLITPTTAATAPVIDADGLSSSVSDVKETASLMKYIIAGNFVGVPAVTVPAGYSKARGLPIGVQVVADFWQEGRLLEAAKVLEGLLPDGPRRPEVFYDVLQ
eukprot:TRINITY_DN5580_c0_g1_i7.p1 TRINITY_DN5580_c0_g1~~TRINITY_DN5580_c0_g1_i7.p1  ORF type:complete len:639 (+),score=188.37 TRINITY_DN5580_c0_g1_i7:479-2395(+)